jgi:hypothetical protein
VTPALTLTLALSLAAAPLSVQSPVRGPSGWQGQVPIENPNLDRVEADIHPSGRGAVAAATHGRKGGASLWLLPAEGQARELWRTDTKGSFSRPRWSPDGSRFAFTIQKAPRWLSTPTPMLQLQGELALATPDGKRTKLPVGGEAARVLGWISDTTLVTTVWLPGDLPEERPILVDLATGAARRLLPDGGHVYGIELLEGRLYFARSSKRIVTLPGPTDVVDAVERDLSGSERILSKETGALPSRFRIEKSRLVYEADGLDSQVSVDRRTLEKARSRLTHAPRPIVRSPGDVLSMPYVHQVYDTPDDFAGSWACGPTSTLMGICHFGRLDPWPITASSPWSHQSDWGAYVGYEYSAYGTTFNRYQGDADGNPAAGAYGWCTEDGGAWAWRMQDYASLHDLSSDFIVPASFDAVAAAIDAGQAVALSTDLTSAGHIIAIKGYTSDGYLIANDPYGDRNSGYMNYGGEGATYSWSEVGDKWLITIYGDVVTPPSVPEHRGTLLSASCPGDMTSGRQAQGSFTYRNDGSATWDSDTKIGATYDRDRGSAFYTAGEWPSPGRPALAPPTGPGGEATFTFTFTAPEVSEPTAFSEHFSLLQEGVVWFADDGGPADDSITCDITVRPPDHRGTLLAASCPSDMVSGTTAQASFTYRNDGHASWNGDTKIGTTLDRDRDSPFYTPGEWLGSTRPAASLPTDPGAENTFTFTLTAPEVSEPTTFVEHYSLVQEGVIWFADDGGPGDDSIACSITVTPRPEYQGTLLSQSCPSAMMSGGTAQTSVTYRNDGRASWDGSTKLGTTLERDRQSPFYTAGNWLSPTRPAAASPTNPGAEVTFAFTMTAPQVTETTTFTEHYSLVQEDITWFADNGGPADDSITCTIIVTPPGVEPPDAGEPDSGDSDGGAPDSGDFDAGHPGSDAASAVAPAGVEVVGSGCGCGSASGSHAESALLLLLLFPCAKARRRAF